MFSRHIMFVNLYQWNYSGDQWPKILSWKDVFWEEWLWVIGSYLFEGNAHARVTVTSRGSNKMAQVLTQWWLAWMWCPKMLPHCIIPLNDNHVHLIHLHVITFCGNSLRMKCTPLGLEKSITSSKEYSKQFHWSHS